MDFQDQIARFCAEGTITPESDGGDRAGSSSSSSHSTCTSSYRDNTVATPLSVPSWSVTMDNVIALNRTVAEFSGRQITLKAGMPRGAITGIVNANLAIASSGGSGANGLSGRDASYRYGCLID